MSVASQCLLLSHVLRVESSTCTSIDELMVSRGYCDVKRRKSYKTIDARSQNFLEVNNPQRITLETFKLFIPPLHSERQPVHLLHMKLVAEWIGTMSNKLRQMK